MKIVIAGGTGFLGSELERFFLNKGHDVLILTRHAIKDNHIQWDAQTIGPWTEQIKNTDVLINLTGKSVDCRYTKRNKKLIYSSRINSTNILSEALSHIKQKPFLWINASSATIYEHVSDEINTEKKGFIGDDFSMNICKEWERVFFEKNVDDIRKVAIRTSIVLGNNSDAYKKLKMLSLLGLGGYHGNGKQMMSWLHIEDFCRGIMHIINDEKLCGPINLTAPFPISNRTFMKTFRKFQGRRYGIYHPKFILEIASFSMRTETELLLKSRYVYPEKLIDSGFRFSFRKFKNCIFKKRST